MPKQPKDPWWQRRVVLWVPAMALLTYAAIWISSMTMTGARFGAERAASVGDAFNALTGALTLLALAAAVYSVLIQSKELEGQREQLSLQAQEMRELVGVTQRGQEAERRAELRAPYASLLLELSELRAVTLFLIPKFGKGGDTPSAKTLETMKKGQDHLLSLQRAQRLVRLTDPDIDRLQLLDTFCKEASIGFRTAQGLIASGKAISKEHAAQLLVHTETISVLHSQLVVRLADELSASAVRAHNCYINEARGMTAVAIVLWLRGLTREG